MANQLKSEENNLREHLAEIKLRVAVVTHQLVAFLLFLAIYFRTQTL